VLASDRIVLPVKGVAEDVENPEVKFPEWQRWNDYGIGSFLKGKAELRQAAEAFRHVEDLGRYDGALNLARVYERQGLFENAIGAVNRAREHGDPAAPPWTLAWLSGVINRQQGNFKEAEKNFRNVLESHTKEMRDRKFDFSKDYVVINMLGLTLFDLGTNERGEKRKEAREAYYRQAVETFNKALEIDSENVTAHYNLQRLYMALGDKKLAEKHRKLHERYRVDDHARGQAIRVAREKYPAANEASAAVVIYRLSGDGK
jgi:tetratricopeptide (TPR) repeat protein